jgi:predicted small metal-binding protein
VPAAIKAEMEKDTATPRPTRTLPDLKGFGVVDCDNCNDIFRADSVDGLLDDLVAHKKAKHGTDRISDNEAMKIRWAREKLEKEVAA